MAVRKIVDQLSRDLLECGICLESFKKPKALPCMHCFCEECLERYCIGQTQVLCPNCKQRTKVPKKGVCAFPAHFIVNTLQDTIDKVKDGAIDDPPCSKCPEKKATVRCIDCQELFCHDCHMSHNSWKNMKAHKVVSMKDLRSEKFMPPLTTTEDQMCKDHDGERKKFYCETCRSPICRDCIVLDHRHHNYVSLKEASKNQLTKLLDIGSKFESSKKKYTDAINKTERVEKSLETASQNIKKKLQVIKSVYQRQLDTIFMQHEANATLMVAHRAKKLADIKEDLQNKLAKIENAYKLMASKVAKMESDYEIISIFSTLSENLKDIDVITEPDSVNENLGLIEVVTIGRIEIPDVITIVKCETVKCKTWKETGQFSTSTKHGTAGIAVNQDGDVAVTFGINEDVKLYSVDGKIKRAFKIKQSLNCNPCDIAVTPDNQYILPGNKELLFCDEEGNMISHPKTATYDVNNKLSYITSIAVDSIGRIILGLEGNTISIHHADGKLISKFATPATPIISGLGVTSARKIAASFTNATLQVMDYTGNKVKVVQPPHGVSKWVPSSVCCTEQGEIFVVNDGDPKAVYSYTSDGDECLGYVISGLELPCGIDITEDGQQLFVTGFNKKMVKKFQRP